MSTIDTKKYEVGAREQALPVHWHLLTSNGFFSYVARTIAMRIIITLYITAFSVSFFQLHYL